MTSTAENGPDNDICTMKPTILWHRQGTSKYYDIHRASGVDTCTQQGVCVQNLKSKTEKAQNHYSDVIMITMSSQITSVSIVYSTVCRGASLAFMRGIQRWPVNSPHKEPLTRKIPLLLIPWLLASPEPQKQRYWKFPLCVYILIHGVLVTPYGDRDRYQYWPR